MADDATRRRMRVTAHVNYSVACPCGRELWGNGKKSHLRKCEVNLAKNGWPLDAATTKAILAAYQDRGADVLRGVQARLGRYYLVRRRRGDTSDPPWSEFSSLVWEYARRAAREGTSKESGT